MIVVGVTSRVDRREMNAVASSPVEQFEFLVDDFSSLAGITRRVVDRIQTVAGEWRSVWSVWSVWSVGSVGVCGVCGVCGGLWLTSQR